MAPGSGFNLVALTRMVDAVSTALNIFLVPVSSQYLPHDPAVADQGDGPAAGRMVLLGRVDAERVEESGGHVVGRDNVCSWTFTAGIAGAEGLSGANAAAGQKAGHGPRPVIAAGELIDPRGAAKFTYHENGRRFQKPASVQPIDEG